MAYVAHSEEVRRRGAMCCYLRGETNPPSLTTSGARDITNFPALGYILPSPPFLDALVMNQGPQDSAMYHVLRSATLMFPRLPCISLLGQRLHRTKAERQFCRRALVPVKAINRHLKIPPVDPLPSLSPDKRCTYYLMMVHCSK